MISDKKIIIVGGGNMGSGLAKGLLTQQWPAQNINFCESSQARRDYLNKQFPLSKIISDCAQLVPASDIIILAIKPQDMRSVCQQIAKNNLAPTTLFISIAAGVPINALQKWLGNQALIIRCMPNTPAAIGQGITGLYTPAATDNASKAVAEEILQSSGQILWLADESLLNAVTALSGSGPAYFYYFLQCLQESGQTLGLNKQDSSALALQTMLGAAQLATQQNEDFSELRAQVTSPGGTTEQAIKCLKKHEFKKIINEAVESAANRAREISQSFNED